MKVRSSIVDYLVVAVTCAVVGACSLAVPVTRTKVNQPKNEVAVDQIIAARDNYGCLGFGDGSRETATEKARNDFVYRCGESVPVETTYHQDTGLALAYAPRGIPNRFSRVGR